MLKGKKKAVLISFILITVFSVFPLEANPPLRSFDELFTGFSPIQRLRIFSQSGLRNIFAVNETPRFSPVPASGINLLGAAMERGPTQLVEALVVVPYSGRQLSKLDIYNVMGRIQALSNYQVYSTSRERYISVFEESTRLEDARRNRPIPDPPPATVLPSSETVYLCLKDTFFGNTYLRGDLSTSRHAITFNITNFTAVRFLIFPVMREEKFTTILYVEPIREGVLIYGMVGMDIPQFLIPRMNLEFNINRRVTVFMNWLQDGIRSIS